jgi:prepilin-type N-terminal cleavage/methylation domain-containing protein
MRKGFTIIELLVASMLLGMLTTILTMIFNQSSIAWRTGTATVANLDDVRDNISEVREEADNAYIWDNKIHRLIGLWDDDNDGGLRRRAWDVDSEDKLANQAAYLSNGNAPGNDATTLGDFNNKTIDVGTGGGGASRRSYTVNVKSAGPNREFGDWDDIWSFPDEFD